MSCPWTSKACPVLIVILLWFGPVQNALAQDRMPPIPADKLSAAQKKAIEEFRAARGSNPGGPFRRCSEAPK